MRDPNQKIVVDKETGRVSVLTMNTEPSMAQQQFKDECDVNNIMKKYQQTGELVHLSRKEGVYADLSEITDYQGMLDTVMRAQDAFAILPAETRLRFQNDPGKLLEFMNDPRNYDEGVKLGLFEPRKTESSLDVKNDKTINTTAPTPETVPTTQGSTTVPQS